MLNVNYRGCIKPFQKAWRITFSVYDVQRRPLTHVDLTKPVYTDSLAISTRKCFIAIAPEQVNYYCKETVFNNRMWRWMSPPARQTPPLPNIGSLARKGAAPEQGAEVYTVLDEVPHRIGILLFL